MQPYFASSVPKYNQTHSSSQSSSTTLKGTSPTRLLVCSTSQPSDANFQSSTSIKQLTSEQLPDGPRYSLRHRKVAQLKPYTVEQLKYKQALRANPDAIVKFKNLTLRNRHHYPDNHYEEDEGTQKDAYIDDSNSDEDGDWEQTEKRWHQRKEEVWNETTQDKEISATPTSLDLKEDRNHSHSQPKELDFSDISDIEIQLPRSKKRALARMLPKSMAFVLVKQAATSSASKKHRRSSTPPASGSDDDEAPLLPGHTRTRKATNLRDIRDIKGDSESEQDIGDDLDTRSLRSQCISPSGSSVSDEVEFIHSLQYQPSKPSGATDRISTDRDEVTDNEDNRVLQKDHRQMSWKEREKARRARAKKQGLYTFISKDQTHIERGRRETAFITVDLQDEGFHYALAPYQDRTQTHNWATIFKPVPERPPARSMVKTSNTQIDQQDSTVPQVKFKKKKQERVIPGDLGIPLLHSGKSFGLSTSIRKGWLHELLRLITSAQEPVLPPSINSCGFELGPTMGADKLVSILQDICSTLFEFVTDLPDVDAETTIRGTVIMRVVPLLISWFSKTEDEGTYTSLREAGEREIARLVDKIQKITLPVVDMSILATCWFAVEMCARLGCRLEGQPLTGILQESAMTLIHFLLQVGLEKPIMIVKSDTNMTEPSVPHFAAELWVSLVHLLGECDSQEKANRRIHPFWLLLMTAIQSRPEGQKPRTNLEASETIWYTIFSLCALSQYSVHGMTTGAPRLPACWDLVVFALKKIRLNEDPKMDLGTPSAMLLQRDKYIGLVMTRCFHLRERWHWKLDDASGLFNQLAVIFRSRKFINLRHEGTEYPKFLKDRNWDLLASYDPKDTAFVIFIKLIVQAAKDDQGSIPGKLSLKTKKLLSLAVPVASLPFSKTNPPTLHELTMFYNRLSAVAIALYLEPDEYDFRTRQAREYIKFADADDTTRSAVIGGMMNWAIMMVNREIKLDAITTWIEEMVQVLSAELKEISLKVTADESNQANSLRRDHLILLSCVLLGAVRHILIAYTVLGRYPEPSLLCKSSSCLAVLASLADDRSSESQAHHAFVI